LVSQAKLMARRKLSRHGLNNLPAVFAALGEMALVCAPAVDAVAERLLQVAHSVLQHRYDQEEDQQPSDVQEMMDCEGEHVQALVGAAGWLQARCAAVDLSVRLLIVLQAHASASAIRTLIELVLETFFTLLSAHGEGQQEADHDREHVAGEEEEVLRARVIAALYRLTKERVLERMFSLANFQLLMWATVGFEDAKLRHAALQAAAQAIYTLRPPLRYVCVLVLASCDEVKEISQLAKQYLAAVVTCRREVVKQQELPDAARANVLPESALPHLIHLIAHSEAFATENAATRSTSTRYGPVEWEASILCSLSSARVSLDSHTPFMRTYSSCFSCVVLLWLCCLCDVFCFFFRGSPSSSPGTWMRFSRWCSCKGRTTFPCCPSSFTCCAT
jgi:Sister chromatid cohesion protein PDS5 protein